MSFKIYTRTGDAGQTGLFGGSRVPKHHIRIESYGTLDELNAHLGLVRDGLQLPAQQTRLEQLHQIQNELFVLGSHLATEPAKIEKLQLPQLAPDAIERLETWIDAMEANLEPLKNFILPAGHPLVSQCHVARCVCRRAERLAVALHEIEPIDERILQYLNRLSDYLFVLSRQLGKDLHVSEVIWSAR